MNNLSELISNQLYVFLIYCLCGIIIGIFFDIFRILRKSFRTPDFVTYIEDIIFCILTGLFLIYTIFTFNNGEIRSYIFVGIGLGILFYLLVFFPGWNWKLNIKNIAWGRCDVWWRFASVFFFIIPATICFLYSSYREERVLNNVRLPSGFLLNWEKTGNSPLKIFKKRAVIVSTLSGKDNLGEITSGRNILVPLSLRQIPIRGVELQLATYNRKNSGQTVFRFLSEEKKILWEKSINNVDVADCKFFKIMFPHRLPVAFLEITANDTRKGNAITCLVSGKGTDNPPNQVKSWKPNCRYLL